MLIVFKKIYLSINKLVQQAMKVFIKITLIFFILVSVSNDTFSQKRSTTDPVVSQLFEMMFSLPQIKDLAKGNQNLIIRKSAFCATNDCEAYVKQISKKAVVSDKKELFQRNIGNYLEISNVKSAGGIGSLDITIYKNNAVYKTLKLQ